MNSICTQGTVQLPKAPEMQQFLSLQGSTTYFLEELSQRTIRVAVDYQEEVEENGIPYIKRHSRLYGGGLSQPVIYAVCKLDLTKISVQNIARIRKSDTPLGKIFDPENKGLIRKSKSMIKCSDDPTHSTRLQTRPLPCYTLSYGFEIDGIVIGEIAETINEESVSRGMPESSLFRNLIRHSASYIANQHSELADSRERCLYPEIPGKLDELQHYLAENEVVPGDCVAIELVNSLPAALTVLALLDGGYSFVLLPAPETDAKANQQSLPKFCRTLITVASDLGSTEMRTEAPSGFLRIQRNASFDPSVKIPNGHSPRIYAKTSGSMGAAKLAVHSYARIRGNILRAAERLKLTCDNRVTLPVPLFHAYGFGAGFLPSLAVGASVDIQERSNILRYLQRESEFKPDVVFVTPTFCQTLLRGRRSSYPYKMVVSAGDRMSANVASECETRLGPLVQLYGSTEMSVIAAGSLDLPTALRHRTVGQPLPGVDYRFIERDVSNGVKDAAGELQLQHPYGFDGYVDLSGNTIKPPDAFDGDWYRTGDLVAPQEDHSLQVIGRCDLSVNRKGYLVAFAEVESLLREIDDVDDVAVVLGAENIHGRELIGYFVGRTPDSSAQNVLKDYHAIAPSFAKLDDLLILDAMPKLPNGKTDRVSLSQMAVSRSSQDAR